jgi:GT2 family glycosyltransferase
VGTTGRKPTTTVVVTTRDQPDELARCLLALDAQTRPAGEVVVVDDASKDPAAVDAAVGGRPRVRVVRGTGAGPAAARNLGAALARREVVCFTDDSCRPGPNWIAALTARFAAGSVAVAGPTRDGRPGERYTAASQLLADLRAEASRRQGSPCAPASNLAVLADIVDGLRFDESLPPATGDEREWCQRLAGAGYVLDWAPDAWVERHQHLSARGFWDEQVRHGRGTAQLRRNGEHPSQGPRFYAGLARQAVGHGPAMAALVVAAQVAAGIGRGRERRRGTG